MIIAIVPALVAVIGALIYAFADGKAGEMGRAMFWCGLLVTLLVVAHSTVRVG